jgi:hypothetical protein
MCTPNRLGIGCCLAVVGFATFLSAVVTPAEQGTGKSKTRARRATLARVRPDGPPSVRSDNLLDQERERRQIRGEQLRKDLAQTIDAARKQGAHDPESALAALKRALTTVVSSVDIEPDVRENLRGRVQATMDQLLAARERIEADRIQTIQRQAAAEAQRLAADQLVQRDEQIEQLIDKVRSLMAEGFAGNGDAFEQAEAVARASFEMAPYSGVTSGAVFDAEAAGQLDKAQRLRYLRYDKFLAQLQEVEKAHIPFPDEPPILYPAPEVWKALTERRQKWMSVDLVRYNPTEERIQRTLSKPTTVEFLDLPLEDCVTFLKEYHNINIWLDKATLADEGVALDQPITLQLAGVSLRSVLKLLLEPLQLTYVIEDEVMKITAATKAGEKLTTRVYPVGDLVIPIINARMLSRFGGMGMMGRGMGMGRGMMGGMGMGGMGMGMGMMNVGDGLPPLQNRPNVDR